MRIEQTSSAFGLSLPLLVGIFLGLAGAVHGQAPANPKLESAIATLRHVDQSKLSDAQMTKKAKDIDAAWEAIRSAGPTGTARLKQEIQAVDLRKEHDNYFKLNASALLWLIGRVAEAETIAAIWNSTPLKEQYNYVFYTAFEAAATQDPKVLPMIEAVLRDQEGKIYVEQHALEIGWPLAQEFIWGVYGAKGLPVLAQLLRTSPDPVTRQSALDILALANYVQVRPLVREMAQKSTGVDRYAAIQTLGMFGHPQDYEFLTSGLASTDPKLLYFHVFALYEFEDLRAVPLLIPMLQLKTESVVQEVMRALLHLQSPASYDALEAFCRAAKSEGARIDCAGPVAAALEEIDLDWSKYNKMTPVEKEKFFRDLRQKDEAEYQPQPGDKTLTHAQLLEVIDEWKSLGRAFEDEDRVQLRDPAKPNSFIEKTVRFPWVEERQILSVATPADVDALIDARARVYRRLSDECLDEVRRISVILQRLLRGEYRQAVGLTEKVVAK